MNTVIKSIKPYVFWLIVITLGALSGVILGASLASAMETLKHPAIQIVSLNEEALLREQSLRLAKLNLDEKSLQKQLSQFKKAFKDLLKELPPHYVVVRSSVLLRHDNVLDLTESFKTALFGLQESTKK